MYSSESIVEAHIDTVFARIGTRRNGCRLRMWLVNIANTSVQQGHRHRQTIIGAAQDTHIEIRCVKNSRVQDVGSAFCGLTEVQSDVAGRKWRAGKAWHVHDYIPCQPAIERHVNR